MKDWNVVASVSQDGFREAVRALRKLGPVDRSRYHNVLVMKVDDSMALLEAVEKKVEDSPRFMMRSHARLRQCTLSNSNPATIFAARRNRSCPYDRIASPGDPFTSGCTGVARMRRSRRPMSNGFWTTTRGDQRERQPGPVVLHRSGCRHRGRHRGSPRRISSVDARGPGQASAPAAGLVIAPAAVDASRMARGSERWRAQLGDGNAHRGHASRRPKDWRKRHDVAFEIEALQLGQGLRFESLLARSQCSRALPSGQPIFCQMT